MEESESIGGEGKVAQIDESKGLFNGGGGPQTSEVKYGGSPYLSCKHNQSRMRDYMDRRVTPPKRVTSPTWGLPPPCKQALSLVSRSTIADIMWKDSGWSAGSRVIAGNLFSYRWTKEMNKLRSLSNFDGLLTYFIADHSKVD